MVDTTYSPAQTGAPQLSGDDITDKMGLLVSKCNKDSRLFDVLQELTDDLLDDTAWPVMQWFNNILSVLLTDLHLKNTALTTGHDLSDH